MKTHTILATFTTIGIATAVFGKSVTLDDGWEFSRGSETNGVWEAVRIPHDWAISGPFDKAHDMQIVAIKENGEDKPTEKTGRSGSLPWIGEGWYRRTVEIPEGVEFASLVFEGAMSEPEIFWDGVKIGEWKYGYNVFEVEVPVESGNRERVTGSGKHTLMVHCRNLGESSRWYPGAGLYRPVKLITGGKVGIKTFGVYVRTPTLQTWEADVELRNPDNIPVIVTNFVKCCQCENVASSNVASSQIFKPWSPEEPNLYTLVTEVRERGTGNGEQGKLLDRRETRFGFRTLEYGSDGFKLNGVKRKFQGVCLHHDLGPIGAEWNAAAFRRQVRKLKWLGCDAIRTSHNMPCPEQMEICDEEGMMVMAESFDMWKKPKCKNGYCRFYDDWWRRDLENLVKVNRSHPCVVMWSIGNEIPEQGSKDGAEMSKEMQAFVHSLDATRPVTQGLNHWPGSGRSGTAAAMDILGMNYRLKFYDYAQTLAKDGIVLGSETASSFSSRGCYYFPVKEIKKRAWYHSDGQCSSYDVECADWSNLPDDDRAMQEDHDWTIGEFVWTGFDYLGEPSPYDTYWPSRSSYFGMYDLAGLPKDRAWLYRSYWNTKEHTLHIVPHWTWPGREGEVTPVYVYTDAPEAELFVNGKSQGIRRKDKTSRLDRYRLRWNDVVYEPGEVKVVAHYQDGTTDEATIRTAGEPARIAIKAEPSYCRPSDSTPALRFFEVSIVDKDGNLCPDAAIPLTFEVTGAARFKGVCNGDATSLEVFTEPKMTTFHGQLVVVVEPTASGPVTLIIKGGGLESKTMFATLLAAIETTATSAIAGQTQPVKIAITNAFGEATSIDAQAGKSTYQPQIGVKVDGFWGEKYKMLVCKWIPHCIRQMEKGGEGEELINLIAAGQKLRGEKPCRSFKGCDWADAYPYNIIEAASLALELDPGDDAELKAGQDFLRQKIEEWIPIILAAQEPSGYIHTLHTLRGREHFRSATYHEFYVMGYFIEMAIAHHRATGDRRLLDAAIKCADHIDSVFGPSPKRTWTNGHPGLEYALCRLSDATGDEKYARLAQYFVRHQHEWAAKNAKFLGNDLVHCQADMPAVEMREAKGHAVRANYFYAAMAAIANRLGDAELGDAAKCLFESAVDRKMYLTGGVGNDYVKEQYGADWALEQDAYGESCAGCGLDFFAREVRRLVGSDKAEAVRERALYNNVLGAIGRNGNKFYYQNPLSSNRPRTSWHGCPCCVGNVPRTLLALKDNAFSVEGDALFINQYMDIENAKVTIGGKEYHISMKTDYPANGKVMLSTDAPIKIVARFPNRTESALYKAEPEVEHGYKEIASRKGAEAQKEYSWELPLPEQTVTAIDEVESCRGKVAYQKGPIVFSWENGEKLPNYDRLNNGGYSEVWRAVDTKASPKPLLSGFHPDPSVCLGHDGAYYLTTSTFMWRPGLPIYRSEDFRTWSLVGHAVQDFKDLMTAEETSNFSLLTSNSLHDDDGVWAPTIRYNDGTYYMVFTFHGKNARNYLTTAKDPAGPWTKPVHIKEGDGGIDPSIFFDDDGKCYWCQESTARKQEWRGHTEIWVQELDLDAGKLVGRREYISSGVFPNAKNTEGPHIYKMGGEYLLIHAEGGTSFDHAATAKKSKSVWGPYKPTRYNPLVTRRDRGKDSPLQATGHADIVKVPNASKALYYAVFLGKRPIGEDRRVILGRETFACPALWRDGDLIFQDERMISGEVITPEEECEALIPGMKIRRVRDVIFDETIEAKEGEAMILYHSKDAKIVLDGPGKLRMTSDDGLTIKCYRDGELVKEVSSDVLCGRHTRFNGLGVGKITSKSE